MFKLNSAAAGTVCSEHTTADASTPRGGVHIRRFLPTQPALWPPARFYGSQLLEELAPVLNWRVCRAPDQFSNAPGA